MLKPFLLLFSAGMFLLLAQNAKQPRPIVPDGVTKRTEDHRVDLSACDAVTVTVPIRDASVSYGEFKVYGWKKYGFNIHITCTLEGR